MTNRTRGDYLERQARDALTNTGWWVIRAAGSLGAADLVALRWDMKPLLVSCKVNGHLPALERGRLLEVASQTGARPVLARRDKPGWVHLVRVTEDDDRTVVAELKVPKRPRRPRDDEADDE